MTPTNTTQSDPYAPFAADPPAWGKDKSVVPEPATYGVVFVGLCMLMLGWKRFRR
jgi:hypothetical protein